jgi:AsmA protein
VLALVGGGYLLLKPDAIATEITKRVQEQTGLLLTAGAPADVQLWPEPAIRLNEVSIGWAPDAKDRAPINAEQIMLTTNYSSLFSGRLEPHAMRAQGVRLNLIIDKDGKANWPDKVPPLPASLRITDGTFTFFDERSSGSFRATGLSGTVDTREGLVSYGEFIWHQQPVRYTVHLKSVARLMQDGSPVSLTANGPSGDLFFDGRVGFAEGLALAGQFSLHSEDFKGLTRWVGYDLQPANGFGSFTLSGPIDAKGASVSLPRADLRLDETAAKGEIRALFSGAVPRLEGKLVADEVDIGNYLPADQRTGEALDEWSTRPINAKGLMRFEALVDLSIGLATYGDLDFRDLKMKVDVQKGRLLAAVQQFTVESGRGSAKIEVDASSDELVAALDVTGEGIETSKFFGEVLGISNIAGKGRFTAAVNAKGRSQADMISMLRGQASVFVADGTLNNLDPALLLDQVSSKVVEGWKGERSAPFRELAGTVTLDDGVAAVSSFTYADARVNILMSGEVDLLRRAVNLRAQPSFMSLSGEQKGWPVAVAITGPWTRPTLFPDIEGFATNPAAGFQKLKTMGLPILPAAQPN